MPGTVDLRRSLPLTSALVAALSAGVLGVAGIVATVTTGLAERNLTEVQRQRQLAWCDTFARRAAGLLERDDRLRLRVLATATADVGSSRALVLDAAGVVVLDTGLVLAGRAMPLATIDAPVVHELGDGLLEVSAPSLGEQGKVGEVRLRFRAEAAHASLFWSVFGVTVLCGLSLVAIGWWLAHGWAERVRRLVVDIHRRTRSAVPIAVGGGSVRDLQTAIDRLEQMGEERLGQVEDGFVDLAEHVVMELERAGLTPPGHGQRTRRYARMLADELDLGEADRAAIDAAARFVDLGKSGVRPSALRKAGGLDEFERESFRQYPARGASLLARVPRLADAAEIVRHHHEKYDGTGYPEGLRATRIPLGSRILAIADAYDLLTTASAVGRGLPWPEALDRLHEDRGSHFDPELLNAFEDAIRRTPLPERTPADVVISSAGAIPYKAAETSETSEDDWLGDESLEAAMREIELEIIGDDRDGGVDS